MPEIINKKYFVLAAFFRSYWMSGVVVLIIFGVSVYPFSPDTNLPKFQYSDKLIHLLMYASLAFILFYEYYKDKHLKSCFRSFYIVLLLFPVIFGGVIEILQQAFFPPRTAEWLDWVSDIVGSLIGFLAAKMIFKDRA